MALALAAFLLALLLLPLLAPLANRPRLCAAPSALLVLALLAGAALAARALSTGAPAVLDLSAWSPVAQAAPFAFTLTLDRLGAFFLLLLCAAAAPVALYAHAYLQRHYAGWRRAALWALLPLFLLSMALVLAASTGFAFFFGWELMTLLSAAAMLLDGDSPERRHNTYIYLVMMHAAAACVLAAFLLFLSRAPALDFASLRTAAAAMPPALRNAAFALALLGFGAKAGLVPVHLWLPKAHPIAPTPVSALMSGVMLKTAVYGMLRFGFDLLGPGPAAWGYALIAAGAVSGVLGVLYALGENDLKRLLAYSSIENLGIIFLALGAALVLQAHHAPVWAALALLAALLHSFNHALFKSLLFLGAGAVGDATHTVALSELGGLQRRMPFTGALVLLGCLALVGLPLTNGFVGEWLAFRGFLAGAAAGAPVLPLLAGVLALIGGLSAACFANLYGAAFLGRPRSPAAAAAVEAPRTMRAGMAALAALCLLVGIAPGFLLRPLARLAAGLLPGAPPLLPAPAAALAVLLPRLALALALAAAAALALRSRRSLGARRSPTWACGQPALTPRMQYTAAAFSEPLRTVFARVYRADRRLELLPQGEAWFPAAVAYHSIRTTSFERSFYRPAVQAIVNFARRLGRLQTGNVQMYLASIFLALIALLVLMRLA